MSQEIDEMLTYVSQIMYQIEQNVITPTEIELIVSVFSRLTKSETRAEVLRAFTRTFATLPPAPPVTEPPDAAIVVESEKEADGREETTAISAEPPPAPQYAARIGAKPTTSTAYKFVGERTSHQLRDEGLRPTRLDEETTKNRRVIDVRSFRDPKHRT